jgi:hypothetical protein
MPVLIVHIQGEDPVVGDVEEMPGPTDTMITIHRPRRRDGKDLPFLDANVNTVIWPLARLNYIELLPSGEEEEMFGFVRENHT